MARCEDFPCCGHESGCCPDFDESGNQLNMICVCGAKLPVNARSSICQSCMNHDDGTGIFTDYGSDRYRSWDDNEHGELGDWEDDEYEQPQSDQQHGNERWGDEPRDWEDSECVGGLAGWGRHFDE